MLKEHHRTVHVALTGTSNCIFVNGISSGIGKHPSVQKFVNNSIGASGTVAIAAHLQGFDLSDSHYVFIEYCINESVFLTQGIEKIENTYRHIAAMVDHAARSGCVPVLVNLPSIRSLEAPTPMFEMMERAFISRGVGVFDAQHLLEVWAQNRGLDITQCFFDMVHLKRPIAFALGTIMVNAMERARGARAISAFAEQTSATYGNISFIPAQNLISDDAVCIRRSNRLLQTALLPLAPGARTMVPSPDDGVWAIRGVAYNAARTIGALTMNQGDTLIDVKRNNLFGIERDLSVMIVPSSLPDIPFLQAQELAYVGAEALPHDNCPVAFELVGIALHDMVRQRPLHVISILAESRHLHQTLDAADFAILNDAWDATRTG